MIKPLGAQDAQKGRVGCFSPFDLLFGYRKVCWTTEFQLRSKLVGRKTMRAAGQIYNPGTFLRLTQTGLRVLQTELPLYALQATVR